MFTSNTTKTKEEKKLIKAVSAILLHIWQLTTDSVTDPCFSLPMNNFQILLSCDKHKKYTEVRKNTFTTEVSNRFKATQDSEFVF